MDNQMKECPWEEIDDFRGYSEFERFVDWMEEQVRLKLAEEVPVGQRYIGATTFDERWFRHVASGTVWRLVRPEAPFAGLFIPVE